MGEVEDSKISLPSGRVVLVKNGVRTIRKVLERSEKKKKEPISLFSWGAEEMGSGSAERMETIIKKCWAEG